MQKKRFSKYGAQTWLLSKKDDTKTNSGVSRKQKKLFHDRGFLSYRIAQYGLTEENCREYLSDREYLWVYPLNSAYSKWVNDSLTFKHILQDFGEYLPKYYYHIIMRDGRPLVVRLMDLPDSYSVEYDDILRLLREKRDLLFRPSGSVGAVYHLQYANDSGRYYMNGKTSSEQSVLACLTQQKTFYILAEYPNQEKHFGEIYPDDLAIVRLLIINEHGDDPMIAEASVCFGCHKNSAFSKDDTGKPVAKIDPDTGCYGSARTVEKSTVVSCVVHPDSSIPIEGHVPNWTEIVKQVRKMCLHMREIEYMAMDLVITDDGFRVMRTSPFPDLPRTYACSERTKDYIARKAEKKREIKRPWWITKKEWKAFIFCIVKRFFCQPGFLPYYANEWVRSLLKDFFTFGGATLKEKLWCYKRGFLSFRKAQYGLSETNWREYISDYAYLWLAPINNSYFKWIDDKVTYRYVMQPCKQYLPEYYYHLIKRNGGLCVVPMQDCPPGYTPDMAGILALLRDKGQLALKQSSGSHGDGFFKLSYAGGQYCINNRPATEEKLVERLSTLSCYYNLTEYLVMHEDLRRIYDGSVNTIRLMVFNRDGKTPEIVNAYMRIGTVSTGLTDNVGYGGVFCRVDAANGFFHSAERSVNHVITPCPNHPDTGVLIEGYVPYWDEVKRAVTEMCLTIPQLEYLGFDVAITDRGIKILEINKHQDLHRCPEYGPYVQAFFKEKIMRKREKLRLDKK